jgi:hypothetical protein
MNVKLSITEITVLVEQNFTKKKIVKIKLYYIILNLNTVTDLIELSLKSQRKKPQ